MEDRYQIKKTDDGDWTVVDQGLTNAFPYPIATYPDLPTAEKVADVLNYHADEEV